VYAWTTVKTSRHMKFSKNSAIPASFMTEDCHNYVLFVFLVPNLLYAEFFKTNFDFKFSVCDQT
jgi:hypothetical protein